ncbi:MAG: sugar phosphate isomerase/epimerase family protein [Spirochaetota bacterium]
MAKFKYSAGLWALGGAADRYVPGGYSAESPSLKKLIEMAASVEGIDGVEIISSQAEGIDSRDLKAWLSDNNVALTSILANTFGDRKFQLGSITNTDPKLRAEAMDIGKKTIDSASTLGCPAVCLWLGSDGYDYCFQIDYRRHWEDLRKSITELAGYNPDIKICLEYKLKEPRKYETIGAVGKALYLARECGDNVGVTLDFGHSLMSKEKPAESVVLLSMYDKMFNVHINDAYGEWDDDMIVGTIHLQETMEFMYYLEQVGYDGWVGLDIFPFRMDGKTAADLCIKNLRSIEKVLDRIDKNKLKQAMTTLDAGNSQKIIRDAIFGD